MGIPNEELNQITDQYLEEVDEDVEVELGEFRSEGWTIDNKEMAMKVDYLLHKLEEKIAEDELIAESQKAPLQAKIDKLEEGKTKIDEWLERSTKSAKATIESLKNHLILFHMRTVEAEEKENEKRVADGKKPLKISKSIKLTYRDLTSKAKQPEIVKDDDKVISWLEDNYSNSLKIFEIENFIKEKYENDDVYVTVAELNEFLSKMNPDFVKVEKKLAWSEYKKTLTRHMTEIKETDEKGDEVIVGTKSVYLDECGAEVPIELIEQGVEFGWKLNK